ncbi:MAG TPA: hypothetical protein GXZ87_07795 [Bacteroidales bacterium]|nr:hypothetical protein [Bacteroidales bacterium]
MRLLKPLILLLTTCFLSVPLKAEKQSLVDSIMSEVISSAKFHKSVVQSYDAEVYMRANVDTKKKNFLYKYTHLIPNFVIHDRKNDKAFIETVSKLKFSAPNDYKQDVNFVNGTLTKKSDIAMLPFRFTSLDIYAESAHGEAFYLPLHPRTLKYYTYSITYVEELDDRSIYSISYTPIYKNPQLIRGSFMVESNSWRVIGFYGEGNDLFVDFSFDIKMGDKMLERYLPVKFNIVQTYKYLGNKVSNTYQTDIKYLNVKLKSELTNERNLNLGNKYRMRLDSVPLNTDSTLWERLRTIPLNESEEQLLAKHIEKQQLAEQEKAKRDSARAQTDATLRIMKNVVLNTNYRFKSGDIRYSGLLNPSMLGYSTQDGFSYRQKFQLGINLPRQQRININLFGGYVFGIKQAHYGIDAVWNYEPSKFGFLNLSAGRGNPTYSSRFLQLIQDSLIKYDQIKLGNYKDYYVKIHTINELTNGLQLGVGIDYHVRKPNKQHLKEIAENNYPIELPVQYAFVPTISFTWTPEQYYIFDRNQKVYVRSYYPTFKLEYAQSLLNVLGGTSSYSKVEFDMSQCIRFGLLESLNYHAGFGFFARQKSEYFNDFRYFAKHYFPETWGDGIGGSFSVLPRHYFNSSDRYAQVHLMYETAKFMFTRLPALSAGVARERIYLSQLYTPYIKSYTEFGYGIGNRYLNAAVFVGFHKLKYESITAKATFLL